MSASMGPGSAAAAAAPSEARTSSTLSLGKALTHSDVHATQADTLDDRSSEQMREPTTIVGAQGAGLRGCAGRTGELGLH